MWLFCNIVVHFRMAKAHECPLAAVCTGVRCEGRYPACRRQHLVEVSSLQVLPKVATAGKSVWMVYLLGSDLGSLLRHENPHCTLCPLQQPSCKTDRPSLLSHISHRKLMLSSLSTQRLFLHYTVVKVGGGIDPATKVTFSFFQELSCSNATAQS